MSKQNKPGDFFSPSQKNEYETTDDHVTEAEEKIENAASFLKHFMGAAESQPIETSTYVIKNSKYQSTKYEFANKASSSCTCQISVPTTFSGEIRMWTDNRSGERVWASVYELNEVDFDGTDLFKYLSGQIIEMSPEGAADISKFFGDEYLKSEIDAAQAEASLPKCSNCGSADIVLMGSSARLCQDCLIKNNTVGL